jgi:hypothetical protein
MEVKIAKCATMSYLIDGNNHRCTLDQELIFRGQGILNLTMAQSLKYLSPAISARRKVRLEAATAKCTEMEMEIRLQKIIGSRLLTIQKINAVKTFLLPTLDFMMLNGDVGKKQLKKMDAKIRTQVDALLNVRGLPVECHHASWRDGGLGYPSLVDQREVLMVRSFTQMMTSKDEKDEKVRTAMRQLTEDERICRRIEEDPGESFLNWRDEHGMRGTTSLAARTRKTDQALNIRLKLEAEEMVVRTDTSKYKTKIAASISHFLTQKVIRPLRLDNLLRHEVHGASFATMRGNEISNMILMNVCARRTDAFFRYVVARRADCQPTPVNIGRWYNRPAKSCRRCDRAEQSSQAHILNGCRANYQLMTKQHN